MRGLERGPSLMGGLNNLLTGDLHEAQILSQKLNHLLKNSSN